MALHSIPSSTPPPPPPPPINSTSPLLPHPPPYDTYPSQTSYHLPSSNDPMDTNYPSTRSTPNSMDINFTMPETISTIPKTSIQSGSNGANNELEKGMLMNSAKGTANPILLSSNPGQSAIPTVPSPLQVSPSPTLQTYSSHSPLNLSHGNEKLKVTNPPSTLSFCSIVGGNVPNGDKSFLKPSVPDQKLHELSTSYYLSGNADASKPFVEIESLVLVKIMKHGRDCHPIPVHGLLLGMDTRPYLEVTNCCPFPPTPMRPKEKHDRDRDPTTYLSDMFSPENEKYRTRMAELMHEVNVDCFSVGWYQTLFFKDLKNLDNIVNMVNYQENLEKAILLAFDPHRHAMGQMAFTAYHLSQAFLELHRRAKGDVMVYNEIRGRDVFVEIPIKIKMPLLVQVFLNERMLADPSYETGLSDSLELDQNNYLESNLTYIGTNLDSLSEEQEKLQKYLRDHLRQAQNQKQTIERRKLENEQRRLRGEPLLSTEFDDHTFHSVEPPNQLKTLLMGHQMNQQVKEINDLCRENIAKLFLLNVTGTQAASGI